MVTAPPTSCSMASLDVGEPIFATAIDNTDLWLLLEHRGVWSPDCLDSPGIAPRTRAWLDAFLADHPRARPQLIRRAPKADNSRAEALRFYFVRSSEAAPAMWSFSFTDPAELERIDLRALVADPRAMPEHRRHRPLFLVCTHGKRDACCARLGPSVCAGLTAEWTDEVWQSSHIGGHRFAATMLCFPHGHCFGRLDASTAARVARGYAAHRITDLLNYRGRTTWARPVQAAEYYLRNELGVYGIEALRYTRGEIVGDDRWRVCFVERDTGETHELTITRRVGPDLAPTSCGSAPEAVLRFDLEGHRQLTG